MLKWATRLDFIYTALTNEQPRVRVADRRQQQTMAAGVYIENRLDLDWENTRLKTEVHDVEEITGFFFLQQKNTDLFEKY